MKKNTLFIFLSFITYSLFAQSTAVVEDVVSPVVSPTVVDADVTVNDIATSDAKESVPVIDTADSDSAIPSDVKEKPAKSYTVTPRLGFYQRLEYNTRNLEVEGNGINWYEIPIYLRSNFKGSVTISKDDFSFTPYLQERFEMFLGTDSTPVTNADGDDIYQVNFRGRNRFYAGFVTKYSIKGIMDVGLNIEFRFANDVKNSTSDTLNAEFRFGPTVQLCGKYDFGLAWNASQLFGFYFNKDTMLTDAPLQTMYYEGFYDISYEFLHHVKDLKDQMAWIFTDYGFGYSNTDYYGASGDYSFMSDFGLGIKYSTKGITPMLAMHLWSDTDDLQVIKNGMGFRAGLNFKKGRYQFGVTYIGAKDINTTDFVWGSRVNTKFSISI